MQGRAWDAGCRLDSVVWGLWVRVLWGLGGPFGLDLDGLTAANRELKLAGTCACSGIPT